MKGKKLVIAVILALIVCLVLIPTCAFADGEQSVQQSAAGEGGSDNGAGNTTPGDNGAGDTTPGDKEAADPASGDNSSNDQSVDGDETKGEETIVEETKGNETEESKVVEEGTSGAENVPLQPESGSSFKVILSYGDKSVELNDLKGGEQNDLAAIVSQLGIEGDIESAKSDAEELFYAADGKLVTSQKFATKQTLTLVVGGVEYVIDVLDDETVTSSQALIKAVNTDNNKIILGNDIKLEAELTIESGKTITIDLNGKTLTNKEGEHTIVNKGNLTIIDSVGGGVVDNVSHGKGALVNVGTATLNGGSFTRSQESGKGGNTWYNIKNHGTLTINEGVAVKQNDQFSSLINNGWYNAGGSSANDYVKHTGDAVAKLTINGGTFSGGVNTVKNDDYGELEINDGTFSNTQYVVQNWNVTKINGGTFTTTSATVLINGFCDNSADKGELIINGGTFNAANGGNGGLFDRGPNSFEGKGTLTINGGTFNGKVNIDEQPYKTTINSGVYTDENVTKFVDTDNVAILTANGKTAIVSGDEDESIKIIIDEAMKSGKPLVIENLLLDSSVSAPEGLTIVNNSGNTIYINGVAVKPGMSYTVPAAPAAAPLSAKYFVIEGKNAEWTKGSNADLKFVLNSKDVVKVLIDGAEVEFTVAEDGTVTIAAAVIEALEAGTHEIEFIFADGSCKTTFTVK